MEGVQCPLRMWLSVYRPDLAAERKPSEQAVLDAGARVGELARGRFPEGKLVPFENGLQVTRQLIQGGTKNVFEGTFWYSRVLVKVDVLCRTPEAEWELIEVKSTLSVKEEHILDVGIQAAVLEKCGIKLSELQLMHLNRDCTYPNLEDLFVSESVFARVREQNRKTADVLNSSLKIIDGPAPEIEIGDHCDTPYECPYKSHCYERCKVPEKSVLNLPGRGWELWAAGFRKIEDLPDDVSQWVSKAEFADRIKRARTAIISGKRVIEQEKIQKEIANWRWPLWHLDFETVNPAIPIFQGTRPYEQTPFQFVVLRHDHPGEGWQVFDYLHTTDTDPRRPLAEKLIACIGAEGSVVAYNARFEAGVISHLEECFPDLAEKLSAIRLRLVDPLPVFRDAVYDEAFSGSYSIKSVAPAILGSEASYEGMKISSGDEAPLAFLKLIQLQNLDPEKAELTESLRQYCQKDCEVMAELVEWLFSNGVATLSD